MRPTSLFPPCLFLALGLVGPLFLSVSRGEEVDSLRRTPIVVAVESATPSVVNIHGHKTIGGTPDSLGGAEQPRKVNGMGTGIVIDPRGYILTNHHVIDGVRPIQVTLASGETYTARLVGQDARTDLAVIKVKPSTPLPMLKVGTSSDLMLGETVIALGNAFGYHNTITSGIISALHRTVEVTDTQDYYDQIQIDACINPGNSGGPLLNIHGDLIGIIVAVRVGAQGIAFAIPVDKAMEIAADLIRAEAGGDGAHGIQGLAEVLNGEWRFVTQSIDPTSPAAKAGISVGDCIRTINEVPIQRQLDVERAFLGATPGKPLRILLERAGADEVRTELVLHKSNGEIRGSRDIDRLAWTRLGARFATVPPEKLPSTYDSLKGGLKVTGIRDDGAAARNGIQVGDILVGMHGRETANLDHLDWILNNPELNAEPKIPFCVIRDNVTHTGQLNDTRLR